MRQSPDATGVARSRWTLSLLLVYKRARLHLHSPDPAYPEKMERLAAAQEAARQSPDTARLLFADEVGLYRQPLLGNDWQEKGRRQTKATLSYRANTRYRVTGSLDAHTGQVVWHGASKVGVAVLCRWLARLRAAYGPTVRLFLAWDNWPVHYHQRVTATATAQRIELLSLPTYAPWTNPIEKRWRKLKQEVLCLHRKADAWEKLKAGVGAFLDTLADPNPALLRYVGLAKERED